MRRILLVASLLVLLANVAALTSGTAGDTRVDAADLPGDDYALVPDPLPTTTVATSTTAPSRPVNPPRHQYAPEPIVVIGTIVIPKLGLQAELHEGITLRNIDLGPSHWPGSAMPGHAGNVVVAGHRVTHTRPFRHIDDLAPGDEIVFIVDGIRSVYTVTGHDVVTPKDTWIAAQTPAPTATLFACHPPGSARYRYVIHAALASTGPA